MAELDLTTSPDERVVAVFRDTASAERAADQARRSGAKDVTVDDSDDRMRAMIGEMREETSESWAGPSVAIATPEMARHIPGPTAVGALIGAVLAIPMAFFVGGDVPLFGRLILAALSGMVGGGTIGFLAGGFLGARRRANLDLAEERGVVVGMQGGNAAAVQALVQAGPLRIDRLVGVNPVDTVESHEDRTPAETVRGQSIPQDEP